jgi:predicted metalloendopeptidase
LEEFTNEQMFFISFGQTWCSKFRPEAAKLRILTDVHSPASVRVTAPLVNFDEFAKTFNCPVGSRMNPPAEQKCKLW